jgi:hypothetical protein
MSVAFRSQTGVAYESTATIEWYGDVEIGYIQQHFVKAIDFTYKANKVDYTQVANQLAQQFEAIIENFNFTTKGINFDFEVKDIDYTQDANKIDKSTKGLT